MYVSINSSTGQPDCDMYFVEKFASKNCS